MRGYGGIYVSVMDSKDMRLNHHGPYPHFERVLYDQALILTAPRRLLGYRERTLQGHIPEIAEYVFKGYAVTRRGLLFCRGPESEGVEGQILPLEGFQWELLGDEAPPW